MLESLQASECGFLENNQENKIRVMKDSQGEVSSIFFYVFYDVTITSSHVLKVNNNCLPHPGPTGITTPIKVGCLRPVSRL